MRRRVLVLFLVWGLTACASEGAGGSTTTLMPIEGDPRYPTTSRTVTTLPVTTTTSTTLPGRQPPGTTVPAGEATIPVLLQVLQGHMDGYGSEDPVKAKRSADLATGPRLVTTKQKEGQLREKGAAERGTFEIFPGVHKQTFYDANNVLLWLCVRSNLVTTDVRTGANIDPEPVPRPIESASVGFQRSGDDQGSQWRVAAYGSTDGSVRCPSA